MVCVTARQPIRESMSRFRRYLVPALLLAPVIFICGKLLLTPQRIDGFDVQLSQRGWPWVFLESADVPQAFKPIDISLFWFWKLAADLAVLAAFIALAAVLVYWHRRRHGGRLQITIRTVLLGTAIAGVGFAWWFHEWRYSQRQEAFFTAFGDMLSPLETAHGPLWLQRLTGNEGIFERVVAVQYFGSKPPTELKEPLLTAIAELPSIRRLSFYWDEAHWEELLQEQDLWLLSGFEELVLKNSTFDDHAISLLKKLPKLRVLDLADCRELWAGQFQQLAELPHLEQITLPATTSPETVAYLKRRIRAVNVAPENPVIEDDVVSPEMNALLWKEFRAAVEQGAPNLKPDVANPQPDSASK